jgi:hypothetical protein
MEVEIRNEEDMIISEIKNLVSKENLECQLEEFEIFQFKSNQFFIENFMDMKIDNLEIDKILKISNSLNSRNNKNLNINVYSDYLKLQNPILKPMQYFNNLIANKHATVNTPFSKSFCFNIFYLNSEVEELEEYLDKLQEILSKHIKLNNIHTQLKDFVINFYVPISIYKNLDLNEKIDMSCLKFIKVIEYEKSKLVIQSLQAMGILKHGHNVKNKLFVNNKFGKILFTDDFEIFYISQFLEERENISQSSQLSESSELNFGKIKENYVKNKNRKLEVEEEEYKKLVLNLKNLFSELESKTTFEKINVDVKITLKKVLNLTPENLNSSQIKFYIEEFKDNSNVFFNSYFHRVFYKTLNFDIRDITLKRFKSNDRVYLKKAKEIYRKKLEENEIQNKNLVVKKRWSYSLGLIENYFKIYNAQGAQILQEEIEKIEDFSTMRKEIKKEIKKVSRTLENNYKIYKKHHRKNILLETTQLERTQYWENQQGQRYFIYVNFAQIDEDTVTLMSNLIQLNHKYSNSDINVKFLAFMHLSEETEYSGDLDELMLAFPTILLVDNQVIPLYNYVNPYDSETSNIFIYIDEHGNITPITVRDENLIEEKLFSLIYPKVEITKEQYYFIKSLSDKFFCENYLSDNKYENRFKFSIDIDKNKIYDENDNLLQEKFYARGKLRIRENDYKEQHLREENFSIFTFILAINEFLPGNPNFSEEIFKDTYVHKVFSITDEKRDKCERCKNLFLPNILNFYCKFCEAFYCETCAKNLSEEENEEERCYLHNLIAIVDFKNTKSSGNLDNLEIEKIGKNSNKVFNELKLKDSGFCCSYCEATKSSGRRFICLNCRGCDLVLDSKDFNSNGFIDICGDCFDLLAKFYKDKEKELNCLSETDKIRAQNLVDMVKEKDGHIFSEHVYIKIEQPTGSYFNY